MQLHEALTSAVNRLTAEQVPSPRMNAELLLMFTLNCDRAYLHAHPERDLTEDETSRYSAAVDDRGHGVPAQYITGHQEFWGMDLIVTPAVLIPRPETEHVIETVLELQASDLRPRSSAKDSLSAAESARSDAALHIADVGTGSGCIALALAKELPAAVIHATDISAEALEIARVNAARHELGSRIQFQRTDLLAGFENNAFDFVVSNPPYVGESEADQVQLEVRKFEPPNAVFAGPTGTEVIARLIPQAFARLKPGGWIVFEISAGIAESVKQLLQGWQNVLIKPDLQSLPRIARAQKPKA